MCYLVRCCVWQIRHRFISMSTRLDEFDDFDVICCFYRFIAVFLKQCTPCLPSYNACTLCIVPLRSSSADIKNPLSWVPFPWVLPVVLERRAARQTHSRVFCRR